MSRFQDRKDLFERRLLTVVTRGMEERRTTRENEVELQRQRKLLDVILLPEIKLHRADVQPLMVKKEELHPEQQERSPDPDLEDNEFPFIKEEQEELWIGQRREQLQGLEEADTKFLFSVHMKSENDEEKPESSLLDQRLTEYMETAAGGEDRGRPKPARSAHPEDNLQQENKVQTKASSDTGSGTEDGADDWRENRDSLKMLKSATNRDEIEKSHVVSLTEKRPFGCLECGKRFSCKSKLRRHMFVHSKEKPFSCSECGKRFSCKSNLKHHMFVHSKEKPFSCSECGKGFNNYANLMKHTVVHSKEKPYICSECGKGFKRKKNLVAHVVIHSKVKPHNCLECGKSFNSKVCLRRHALVHSKEKPYICSECGKGFRRKTNLVVHVVIHSKVKPYNCLECGKKFKKNGNLTKHMVVHSKEKPYICSECGKEFKRKKNLVVHVVIHSKVKPYSCSECGKGFNFKVCLRKHGCSLNRKTNAEKLGV